MMQPPVIAIIIPCFNEDSNLLKNGSLILRKLQSMIGDSIIGPGSFILFVDDGSTDSSWSIIEEMSQGNPEVRGIRLSGNCGQQNALLAGMEWSTGKCDASVTIDADLQDDPDAIPAMITGFREGADVVCGVRDNRDADTWFKRNSALSFYRLMRQLGVDCLYNHADFRLLSARAMSDLLEYGERNMFLRGIVPKLGYRQERVFYKRAKREAGETKYPLRKMLEFAIDGITSFSVRPVRMLFWIGLFFLVAATAIGIYTFIRYFMGETIEGWASLILSIWFCTGILLMGMGVMGEYIGKIYIEVKKRPRYKISQET